MMKVYGIKNCGSVKKALSFFKANDIEYEFCDLKKESVTCDKVSSWLEHVDMKTLFNTKGMTYRKLGLKELNLDDDGKKEWLCKENMLIKRPVIEFDGKAVVGFDEDVYKGAFL